MSVRAAEGFERLKYLSPEQPAEVDVSCAFLKAWNEWARDAAAQRLGKAFEKLDALDQMSPSAKEIEAEIDEARSLRRDCHVHRR